MRPSRVLQRDALEPEWAILFVTPGNSERLWLCRALQKILLDAPWIRPLVGGDELESALEQDRHRAEQLIPPSERGASIRLLTGDFGYAGAIIGKNEDTTVGMSALRGVVWIALRRWNLTGRLSCTAADSLTDALRASVTPNGYQALRALTPLLDDLTAVNDMAGALRALAHLEASSHKGLCKAWPALRKILHEPSPQLARPTHESHERAQRHWSRLTSRNVDRSEILAAQLSIIPLRRRAPIPDQAPGEPCDEFSSEADIVLVPGFGTGAMSRRRAEYQARQAIWSRNLLLLESHIEALPADAYGAALRALVDALEREDADGSLAPGYLACLLKALTGRTTPGIQWLCRAAEGQLGMGIDLDRGAIEFPPFWKVGVGQSGGSSDMQDLARTSVGYFRAQGRRQREWLNPVSDRISLPLARPLHRALRRHANQIFRLPTLDEEEIDRRAADAARALVSVGIPITVATLRRSLGPQVMEASGDLAMAQLICGDSFGRPLAQLHYYSPRRKDIAAVYAAAVSTHFQERTATPLLQGGARVGAELLATPKAARTLALSSSIDQATSNDRAARGTCARRHRDRVDHLARMILATSGHRPTESLFALTLHDFDLRTGAALFCDKKIDAAHDPRLAVLPTVTCHQVDAYVHHLLDLADQFPDLREAVDRVCSGSAPLLFDVNDALVPVPLTLTQLKARAPAEWHHLPWNWGRTYLRTRGIEAGAPAFLMACQLGHYDAVGYPYSHQSPTSPTEVVRETRPWLDRNARSQGWKVAGKSGPPRDGAQVPLLCPLRDWRAAIRESERAAVDAHRKWETALRRQARQSQGASLQQVLEHPDLVAAGIAGAFHSRSTDRPQPLDESDLFRIRSELVDAVGDDAAAAISVTRALRRVLGSVTRLTGQSYPAVPLPVAVRRPLENPFFPGACLALSQMHALRDNVAARSAQKRPDRSFLQQIARTAEALALFGFVADEDQLRAILEARVSAVPSANIVDLLLVPLGDGQVIALRGVAALALANLARTYPTQSLPDDDELDAALARLLPAWAADGPMSHENILARLCSTTAVANRFELSPAARFAADPMQGSTPASLAEQLAFIDGDAVGPDRSGTPPPEPTQVVDRPRPAGSLHASLAETPRAQYVRLCRAIPQRYVDRCLPLTQREIKARDLQAPSTREAILAEVDAQLAQPHLAPIVSMLGDWIRAEARRVGSKGHLLAYRTLETYLTRVGNALVETLGAIEPAHWSEELLEDAYLYALDAAEKSRHKVAEALLSFHRHCASRWDLPDLDLSFLYAWSRKGRHNADADLILPVERNRALEALRRAAWDLAGDDFGQVQVARSADWVAYFLAWGGARLSEALGLQARDVGMRPDGSLWTTIRPNRMRPLKTVSAGRALGFGSDEVEHAHRTRVLRRVEDARLHAGSRRPGSAYLLHAGIGHDSGPGLSANAVAQAIRRALADATGRPGERLHRLRHLAATTRILAIALARDDRRALGLDPHGDIQILTPRDIQAISVAMGHSHWRMTIQWYLHIPWILESRAAASLRDGYCSRRYIAGALGLTAAAIDSVLRAPHGSKVSTLFDYFRPPRRQHPNGAASGSAVVDAEPSMGWTAQRVGRLVELAGSARDLEPAMRMIGAPMQDIARVLYCFELWEAKLGVRLLPTRVGGHKRECPRRAFRRMEADRALEILWADLDAGRDVCTHRAIVRAFFTWARPRRSHEILLPCKEAGDLVAWLRQVGLPSVNVDRAARAGGVECLTMRSGDVAGGMDRRRPALCRVLAIAGVALDLMG